ncbi:MAG: hypothetical protein NZ992_00670 [Candidatus Korarchaeum sp.]|nr:hypothetical protein [Candidatus Korarchaeum sp.]MDW8035509.1 hypothetical protein [Candidatus Korarchaeum sp.]
MGIKRILISLDPFHLDLINKACESLGLTRSALLRIALYYYISQHFPSLLSGERSTEEEAKEVKADVER